MASHRPPNFTHLPPPTPTDRLGAKGGDWPPMGKGASPRSAFGHKGATGLPYFPRPPLWCPYPHRLGAIPHWPQRHGGHWPPTLPLGKGPGPFGGGSQKQTSKGLGRLRLWGKGQSDPLLVQLLRKNSACKNCTHKISMGAKKPHPTLPFAPTRPLT